MNLEKLWRERSGGEEFKDRDNDYKRFEDHYRKKDKKNIPTRIESFKPLLIDDQKQDLSPRLLNPAAQIVKHFAAMFARLPRITNVPFDPSQGSTELAAKMTAVVNAVAYNSGMQTLQPRQAHWYSLRGDAVYGIEWTKERIFWRGFDPAWCYPAMSALDYGGCDDMLIHFTADAKWAREQYKVAIPGNKKKARIWIYWDSEHKETQVEGSELVGSGTHTFDHDLNFCPFRWGYSQPTGHFAQSDVQDVIDMADTMNETIILALDATRMNVYKSYWGKSIREGLVPKPGEIIAFNSPEAEIHDFPTAPPPEMIMGLLQELQQYARASGGISPVSAEGVVGGSIVTGAAVRHQVEAIEARAETKRVLLEALFAKMGEYTLKVLERQFKKSSYTYRQSHEKVEEVAGEEIKGWTECEANYGVIGMDGASRQRWAMEGLGRVHDDYKAIEVAWPNEDPQAMVKRVEDFQIRQAEMSAKAQAMAQKAMQEAQAQPTGVQAGGGGIQGGGPQVPHSEPPTMPQPPKPSAFMQQIESIEAALTLVAQKLKGTVWAIGDLAIAGMAQQPMVMVEKTSDLPMVQSALQPFKAVVMPGTPDAGTPKLKLE